MTPARLAGLALSIGLGLAGCASTPAPPVRYYQLRIEPPAGKAPAPSARPPVAQGAWQLMVPVRMPDYLDRDELWLSVGSNALQPLEGHRWVEPLRSAVQRTLSHDLGLLHGAGSVWSGTAPAGVVVARQLRLELLEFAPSEDRGAVRLRARWTAIDPSGSSPPQVSEANISVPSAGPQPYQLVDAHRLALWQLAERMAALPADGQAQ
ncbi:MAG TPA: PqiC family protein [Ideonella sp.]|nr:PqiC family protein [Ideonella sp.]